MSTFATMHEPLEPRDVLLGRTTHVRRILPRRTSRGSRGSCMVAKVLMWPVFQSYQLDCGACAKRPGRTIVRTGEIDTDYARLDRDQRSTGRLTTARSNTPRTNVGFARFIGPGTHGSETARGWRGDRGGAHLQPARCACGIREAR